MICQGYLKKTTSDINFGVKWQKHFDCIDIIFVLMQICFCTESFRYSRALQTYSNQSFWGCHVSVCGWQRADPNCRYRDRTNLWTALLPGAQGVKYKTTKAQAKRESDTYWSYQRETQTISTQEGVRAGRNLSDERQKAKLNIMQKRQGTIKIRHKI